MNEATRDAIQLIIKDARHLNSVGLNKQGDAYLRALDNILDKDPNLAANAKRADDFTSWCIQHVGMRPDDFQIRGVTR